jgi:hypothetical protein
MSLRPLAIFYSDGSVIECGFEDDEEIEITLTFKLWKKYYEAPVHGVGAIVQADPIRCRHTLRGVDNYYPLPDGMLHAADDLTPWQVEYLQGIIKKGVCQSDQEYKKLMQSAKHYDRIPRNCVRTETEPDAEID